jgi:hypothetical protein
VIHVNFLGQNLPFYGHGAITAQQQQQVEKEKKTDEPRRQLL